MNSTYLALSRRLPIILHSTHTVAAAMHYQFAAREEVLVLSIVLLVLAGCAVVRAVAGTVSRKVRFWVLRHLNTISITAALA